MSKHVGYKITQEDCCDIYFYDISCAFVGYTKNKKITLDFLRNFGSLPLIDLKLCILNF